MPDYLFVGPSAYGLPISILGATDARIRPPVRRSDIEILVNSEHPGRIVIVDGIFQHAPAVGHAELVSAVRHGWEVWGLSSIGAIRAYELRDYGMNGFGYVYEQFFRYKDFRDDELCLLHNPEPPFHPLTEPLVNLRYLFECQTQRLGLDDGVAEALIKKLRSMWFGYRDHQAIESGLLGLGATVEQVTSVMSLIPSHRIKGLDLKNFISLFWR